VRLNQFSKACEIYAQKGKNVEEIVMNLKRNGIDLEAEFNELNNARGNFFEHSGNFRASVDLPETSDLSFVSSTNRVGGLKVVNGTLFLKDTAYYWSNQIFSAKKNYKVQGLVKLGADEESLIMGIGPNVEHHGMNTTSWTLFINNHSVWIRKNMFNDTLYFNKINFNTQHFIPFTIQLVNGVITCEIDGKNINCRYQYPYDTFRIGIITWSAQTSTFLKILKIIPI
jgi:hypothetical protein